MVHRPLRRTVPGALAVLALFACESPAPPPPEGPTPEDPTPVAAEGLPNGLLVARTTHGFDSEPPRIAVVGERELEGAANASFDPSGHHVVVGLGAAHGTRLQMIDRMSGEVRELPVPPTQDALEPRWSWRFSPDGRQLCVLRRATWRAYWPHGMQESMYERERDLLWLGIIDLETSATSTFPHLLPAPGNDSQGLEILGWDDRGCVVRASHRGPIWRLPPGLRMESMHSVGTHQRVSARGRFLLESTHPEARGSHTRIVELSSGRSRWLFGDNDRMREYAQWVAVGASLTPDESWLVTTETHFVWKDGERTVAWQTLRVEDPWGSRVRFSEPDADARLVNPAATVSPDGQTLAYGRCRDTCALAIVSIDDTSELTMVPLARSAVASGSSPTALPPLWSPDSQRLLFADHGELFELSVAQRAARSRGPLDENILWWSWSDAVAVR